MSELSPGSKLTTNIFMVLGGVALLALVIVQNLTVDQTTDPVSCDDRLVRIDAPAAQNTAGTNTTVYFYLLPDGSVDNIEVSGSGSSAATTDRDGEADTEQTDRDIDQSEALLRQAVAEAEFTAAVNGETVRCEYTFR